MPTSDSRSAKMAKPMKYTVSDGKLVLTLEVAEEDGYIVTVPMDPVIKTIVSTGGGGRSSECRSDGISGGRVRGSTWWASFREESGRKNAG